MKNTVKKDNDEDWSSEFTYAPPVTVYDLEFWNIADQNADTYATQSTDVDGKRKLKSHFMMFDISNARPTYGFDADPK